MTTHQYSEFSLVLKPSSVEGIGVFTTHDIPIGTTILTESFALRRLKNTDVPEDLIKYCTLINDEECVGPERFDRLEIGWFINHSATPNIAREPAHFSKEEIESTKPRPFVTLRDIKAGEEIFVDYNYLNEPEHLKEDYYKK